MKYNLYKVKEIQKDNGKMWDCMDTHHKLILIQRFDSMTDLKDWLKKHKENYVEYVVMKSFFFTPFEEESNFGGYYD